MILSSEKINPSDEIQNCHKILNTILDKMERGHIIEAYSLAKVLQDRILKTKHEVVKLETYKEMKGK